MRSVGLLVFFVVKKRFRLIKLIFNISDEVWIFFNCIDNLEHSLLLFLIILSQLFIELEKLFVLLVKVFELSRVLRKVDLLFSLLFLENFVLFFGLTLERLD